ncbi:MAG: putative baseplate assembly protein [Actinomycetota bacterium]
MAISVHAPNLDDRRFQELVDEAKRMVQRRCPAWTDHNVSDPGVTLIEAFAYMVDQLIYRLNRVPDQQYLRYLELMGVDRLPPSAATVPVTFWLSAPLDETVLIERGTEVATRRHRARPPVVFATVADLPIVPVEMTQLLTFGDGDAAPEERRDELAREEPFDLFNEVPRPRDALLVGLSAAAPSCSVRLDLVVGPDGDGIDRHDPPLMWEAMTDGGWVECDVEDGTGGFIESGPVTIHLPAGHAETDLFGRTAGWLRCVVTEPEEDQAVYTATPTLEEISASTVGGTTVAVHGEDVESEIIGVSDGSAGQRFALTRAPVVRSETPHVLEVSTGEGWDEWMEVQTFAESDVEDHHWQLEAHDGVVLFGPAVREGDGAIRQRGAIPPEGARLRVRRYRTGGGRDGNVARNEIVTLRSAIPFVSQVENRVPAAGGLDAETPENARDRGPLVLGTRDRAVTLADYEYLAHQASGRVARVRAVEVGEDGAPASPGEGVAVKLFVVPTVGSFETTGEFRFDQLVPGADLLEEIQSYLAPRRMVGTRVMVGPSRYVGVTVAADIRVGPNVDRDRAELEAMQALYGYLSPLVGGPDGEGWPYGRPLHVGELYGVLQAVEGVMFVEGAQMFPTNPTNEERQAATDRIPLNPDSLFFPMGHSIQVRGPEDN